MFNTAIDYDKKYRKAFYRRGATRFVLSDYVSAASDFGKAEIYLPKDSVYYLIGNSYLKQGDRKKARKYLEKALNLNPDNLSFLQALSQVRRNSDTVAIVTYTTISDVYVPLETYPTEITDSIDNEPPGKIETTYEYFAGIAKVRSKRKYGFIDTLGQLVVPFIYDDVRSFKWSFAAYRKGNLWGFLGHSGTPVIEARFLAVEDFDGLGVAAVKQESGWGVINVSGDIIIPAEFSSIDPFHFDSLLFVRKIVNNRFLWGIYTIQGRLVSPPIYTDFNNFWFDNPTYKYIHLSLNGKWGVVDRENKTIIPFNYYGNNSIRFFKNGFAPVKVNERWGFVDLNGEEVVKPVFDNVKNFENGFFEVKQKGMWGIIDLRGDTIIPFIYDELKHLKFNFWAVRKNQKWAFTDIKENKTTQFLFDEVFNEIVSSITQKDLKIEPIKSSKIIVRVKNNGRQFYANEKGSCVLNCRE
jgi:hypothetical protein